MPFPRESRDFVVLPWLSMNEVWLAIELKSDVMMSGADVTVSVLPMKSFETVCCRPSPRRVECDSEFLPLKEDQESNPSTEFSLICLIVPRELLSVVSVLNAVFPSFSTTHCA